MSFAVFTTLDDPDAARALAARAVEAGLAACVQMHEIASVYRWEGAVRQDTEWRLLFKTGEAALPALKRLILESHPYDEPALWAHRIDDGAEGYLNWIAAETTRGAGGTPG